MVKRTLLIFTVLAVLIGVGVFSTLSLTDERVAEQHTSPTTAIESSNPTQRSPNKSPMLRAFPESDTAPLDPQGQKYDGMVLSEVGEWVPIRRIYKNCHNRLDATGEKAEFRCDVVSKYAHPYDDFTYEQLNAIADHDAAAAFILGQKMFHDAKFREEHFDYEKAVGHMLSASVLSNQPQPYMAMLRSRELTEFSTRSGVMDVQHAKESYIWMKAGIDAGLIDKDDKSYSWLVSKIRSNRFENDGVDFVVWNDEAEKLSEFIKGRRATLTGK